MRGARLILGTVAIIGLAGAFAGANMAGSPDKPSPADVDRAIEDVSRKIARLVEGSRADKLEIAASLRSSWKTLAGTEDDRVDALMTSLRQWMADESDDWVRDRVLVSLRESKGLDDLFRDALGSESPNLRFRGARYAYSDDPRVRELMIEAWRGEKRPWIREVLIPALGPFWVFNGEQLVPIVSSDHRSLAVAAIDQVGIRHVEAALPKLVDRATGGLNDIRSRAITALGRFHESLAAERALLELSRSAEDSPRNSAVRALADFRGEVVTIRLLDVVAQHDEKEFVRLSALWGLEGRDHPEVVPLLHALEGDDSEPAELRQKARMELVARGLLAPPDRVVKNVTISCGGMIPWRVFRVVPVERDSLRCFAGPGIISDEARKRIPAGARIELRDHFESDGDHWVRVLHYGSCWIKRPHLKRPDDVAPSPDECAGTLVGEWDLPAELVDSTEAEALIRAGLLEIVEDDGLRLWIAVRLDPDDREGALLLEAVGEADDGPLGDAINYVVSRYDVCRQFPADPTLRPLPRGR